MKSYIYNKVKAATKGLLGAGVVCAAAASFTSCNDFLSIEPLNEIVLERYWTEEADVNSTLMSCYSALVSEDCVRRMIIWGEGRSEDMIEGRGNGDNDLRQLFKENILETNKFVKWDVFFQVINRCNTVLHYAPEVNRIDPNFTDSELSAVMAEATTLRSLAYFYLVRTFRDVPYESEPSIDDTRDYKTAPLTMTQMLDTLITDMESIADDAVRLYGEHSAQNTNRITRWSAYALLADLHLWRGNWQKCIDYCDKIVDYKLEEYQRELELDPTTVNIDLYGRYPLYNSLTRGTDYAGYSYTQIFGQGNSFETIFELYFDGTDVKNNAVNAWYGSQSQKEGQIGAANVFGLSPYESGNTNEYFTKEDGRYYESFYLNNANEAFCQKYVVARHQYKNAVSGGVTGPPSYQTSGRANWIIYRLSDILLMRAEAEIQLAGNYENNSAPSEEEEGEEGDEPQPQPEVPAVKHLTDAFACINAISRRGLSLRKNEGDTLKLSDYVNSSKKMEELLFAERHRELIFEGKRWYDLVRLSLREGDNTTMINKVTVKFMDNVEVIKKRLQSQDALFLPYHRDELKANPFLKQNPAFNSGKNYE